MRTIRFRPYLRDGSVPGDVLPPDVLPQRGWNVRLVDAETGDQVLRCQHATIELDANGTFLTRLTFANGTVEDAYAFLG